MKRIEEIMVNLRLGLGIVLVDSISIIKSEKWRKTSSMKFHFSVGVNLKCHESDIDQLKTYRHSTSIQKRAESKSSHFL